MPDWFEFLVLVLICYRLAQLLAIDEGPAITQISEYGIFHEMRVRLGAYDYGSNGEAITNLGRGAICPHCWGIWIALPLAFIMSGLYWHVVFFWLAIAGGQSFLWSVSNEAE
jgi:hypothetical protein